MQTNVTEPTNEYRHWCSRLHKAAKKERALARTEVPHLMDALHGGRLSAEETVALRSQFDGFKTFGFEVDHEVQQRGRAFLWNWRSELDEHRQALIEATCDEKGRTRRGARITLTLVDDRVFDEWGVLPVFEVKFSRDHDATFRYVAIPRPWTDAGFGERRMILC